MAGWSGLRALGILFGAGSGGLVLACPQVTPLVIHEEDTIAWHPTIRPLSPTVEVVRHHTHHGRYLLLFAIAITLRACP